MKTGTKEWSDYSMNIQRGCEHGCRYCYGRYNAVERFKLCEDRHWQLPCINEANSIVKSMHRLLDGLPFIKWKDSIREVVENG